MIKLLQAADAFSTANSAACKSLIIMLYCFNLFSLFIFLV